MRIQSYHEIWNLDVQVACPSGSIQEIRKGTTPTYPNVLAETLYPSIHSRKLFTLSIADNTPIQRLVDTVALRLILILRNADIVVRVNDAWRRAQAFLDHDLLPLALELLWL